MRRVHNGVYLAMKKNTTPEATMVAAARAILPMASGSEWLHAVQRGTCARLTSIVATPMNHFPSRYGAFTDVRFVVLRKATEYVAMVMLPAPASGHHPHTGPCRQPEKVRLLARTHANRTRTEHAKPEQFHTTSLHIPKYGCDHIPEVDPSMKSFIGCWYL